MHIWYLRNHARLIFIGILLLGGVGCQSTATPVPKDTLRVDGAYLPTGDLAGPGLQQVISAQVTVSHQGQDLGVTLFRPAHAPSLSPAIVFLPGRMASNDQYESYARALASRGFIVAMRGWYSLFTTDEELAQDARVLADWLTHAQGANPHKIGIAGHSMGGKDAVLAAAKYGLFASVVAIDPDDNGTVSVVNGVLPLLHAPLLLIGAEVAWQASSVCAPKATNYLRFFERSPPGTVELTLRDADHVQMLDEPDRFGYGICRCGTANSQQVRITARRATVAFFVQHLMAGALWPPPMLSQAFIRVAQNTRQTVN